MAVRSRNTLFLISFFCLSPLIAIPLQASPLARTLTPVTATITTAACIDPWRKTQPCRSVSLLNDSTRQGNPANRWWLSLWTTAGEVATSPQFVLGGKRVSCGGIFDRTSLVNYDFTNFQLNMDVDLDTEEERFDTVRVAYRSCWR